MGPSRLRSIWMRLLRRHVFTLRAAFPKRAHIYLTFIIFFRRSWAAPRTVLGVSRDGWR